MAQTVKKPSFRLARPASQPCPALEAPALRQLRAGALALLGAVALLGGNSLPAQPRPVPAAEASPWERVGVYEGRTLYVDPTTVRRSGTRLQVWTVTDLKESNATARGRAYWSKKALLEIDCSQRTLKVLQDTWYTRHMGQGEPVYQTEGGPMGPFPIQSDSPGELFYKGACGRR